jgi:hypothetical protein
MPHTDGQTLSPPPAAVMSACPQCKGGLAVLSIIPGRAGRGGCEYFAMRCTDCGGIHLDIVNGRATEASADDLIA